MSVSINPLDFVMPFLASGRQNREGLCALSAYILAFSEAARAAQPSPPHLVTTAENVQRLADRISDAVEGALALKERARGGLQSCQR